MQRRLLGSNEIEVSELGFGCAGFWGRSAFSDTAAVNLVHRAMDSGVTLFDTGPSYGNGEAERRLGEALRGHREEDLVIATKAGTLVGKYGRLYKDFSPAAVRGSVEGSLRRLGLDQVTLLHLHGPGPGDITDDLIECLEQLKRSGMVRFCGINGYHPEVLRMVPESGGRSGSQTADRGIGSLSKSAYGPDCLIATMA